MDTTPTLESTPQKKFNPIVAFVLVIVMVTGLLLLMIGGVAWYGWQFDKEIPIVSRPVRYLLASVGEPKATAQVIQENLNATLVTTMYPVIESNPDLMKAVSLDSDTKAYIKELQAEYKPITSLKVDLNVKADSKSASPWSGEFHIKGQGTTADPKDSRSQIDLDLTINADNKKYGGTSILRFMKDRFYLKVDRIEGEEAVGVDVKDYLGKWFHSEMKEAANTAKTITGNGDEFDSDLITIWSRFLNDKRILSNPQRMPDRTFNNETSYCLQLSWNKQEAAQTMRIFNEIARQVNDTYASSEESVVDSVKELELTSLNICTGKESHRLYYIANSTKMTGSAEGTYTFDLTVTDHNVPISIEEPTDSADFDKLIEEQLNEANGVNDAQLPADVPMYTGVKPQFYFYQSANYFQVGQEVPNQTNVTTVATYIKAELKKQGWTIGKSKYESTTGVEIIASKGKRDLSYNLIFAEGKVMVALTASD